MTYTRHTADRHDEINQATAFAVFGGIATATAELQADRYGTGVVWDASTGDVLEVRR
jgi:hypothetical protein